VSQSVLSEPAAGQRPALVARGQRGSWVRRCGGGVAAEGSAKARPRMDAAAGQSRGRAGAPRRRPISRM